LDWAPELQLSSLNSVFMTTLKHQLVFLVGLTGLLSSCAIQLSDCAGPLVNTEKLSQVQQDRFFTGPQGYLVLPNPVDSPRLSLFSFSASTFRSAQQGIGLPNLQSASALENSFLKVRLNGVFDSTSKLVGPQNLSSASSDVKDPQYSQVMAYHAITSIQEYAQSLGFSVDKSRPLYVMVRSAKDPSDPAAVGNAAEVNAYYVHNKFNPRAPRFIQVMGDTNYPLAADRDTFWHEFGHLLNESISSDRGIDEATDLGANYVESRAIHECLADYLDESASNKPYIGKWGAKNFSFIKSGNPLRWAQDMNDDKNNFANVANYDPSTQNDRNYRLAEWCSRVLWDIRTQFQKEDKQTGAFFSDRMVLSALTLLGKNASVSDFRTALLKSDTQLHCGLHQQSIKKAFESRGFDSIVPYLSRGLSLSVSPVGYKDVNGSLQVVTPNADADEIVFNFQITNPNGALARNVRLQVESSDAAVVKLADLQGFGDLPAGKSVRLVGTRYIDYVSSVSVSLDRAYAAGRTKVRFVIKALFENGPSTSQIVELNL